MGANRIRDTAEDGHESGNNDEERPAMTPGEDVEAVEQKEDTDQNDPDGAAQSTEEAIAVGGGSVVGETGAGVGHLADEEPDTKTNQKEGHDTVHGKAVEDARVSYEKEATESDKPKGAGGKRVSRE